jgi:hypothetical protein
LPTKLSVSDVRRLPREAILRSRATRGRADAALSQRLRAVEADHDFTPRAGLLFQQLLARLRVPSARPLAMAPDRLPYWLRGPQPLANYQSGADLPASADVVIIGAGLAGASTAYHLGEAVRTRALRVVVPRRGQRRSRWSSATPGHTAAGADRRPGQPHRR